MEVGDRRPDGSQVYFERRVIPEFDAQGRVVTLLSISRDITERKKNEDMLRIAAAAFETHEAILITDSKGKVIRVNQAFQAITGYLPEDVLGHSPSMLTKEVCNPEIQAQIWQSIVEKNSWTGEIRGRRKNGDEFPVWLTITAVRDDQNRTSQYVGIFSDIWERKRAQEEIANLAFYDPLTKLPNRRLMQDRFQAALKNAGRTQLYGAVLFLDLDKFKQINDTFGHSYGDLLLIEVAHRLRSCVRETDTVARLGGDEFIVLIEGLPGQDAEASQLAEATAERIRKALALPYLLEDRLHYSSPSIGICLFRDASLTVDALLKFADAAMYQAKEAGRNTVRFYDPVAQQHVDAKNSLESDMRLALEQGQFQLHYQLQVDDAHRPLGAEALIRWLHPHRGLVPPAEFIPVAEESSLIFDIGHWVLKTACQQLQLWAHQATTRALSMAVNVSAKQFLQPNFVESTLALLREHSVDPRRLKLELTEGVMIGNLNEVVDKMSALKALGIKLSLDDFGTGYSSLSYLKLLPLDQLKIDRLFVRNLTGNPRDAILVRTIIDMARNFELDVIAEGVETMAELAFLRQHGCLSFQGYLFGKPLPADQFLAMLGPLGMNPHGAPATLQLGPRNAGCGRRPHIGAATPCRRGQA